MNALFHAALRELHEVCFELVLALNSHVETVISNSRAIFVFEEDFLGFFLKIKTITSK